jgi:D-lactate dehydrogenase
MIVMNTITFYDTSETDKQQLQNYLDDAECEIKYFSEPISVENVDPNAEVISIFVTSNFTVEMLKQAPKLKLIVCRSTGFNNVNLAACAKHGVTVTNVPSYGENTVAEYAFTLLLGLSRKLIPTVQEVNFAQIDHSKLHGFDLAGKTIGIIGMGRIGQHSARIAKGFDMEVIACDPFPNAEKAKEIGYTYVTKTELAKRSDVICLHAFYCPENHHMIDETFLKHVKPSAVLINTARGELVDTAALVEALGQNRLAGAGLDVIEGEDLLETEHDIPLLGHHINTNRLKQSLYINILEKLPNVILTPHNAYNTIEAIGRINKTAVDNILAFQKGTTQNEVKA